MDVDSLLNEKIDEDSDFQASLVDLSDEDKVTAIETKKKEILDGEFTSLKEKAEKAEKAEELAKNYKTRAEKAETDLKAKREVGPPPKDDLSSKDLYALVEAKVPQEDVDEVVEWAKFKKIPVAEALKSTHIQSLLKENAEFRTTAAATNKGTKRPATKSLTGEEVLKQTNEEEKIPEPGSKEAEELFWAKRGGRPSQK